MLADRTRAMGAPHWLALFRAHLLDQMGQSAAGWLSALLLAGAGMVGFGLI